MADTTTQHNKISNQKNTYALFGSKKVQKKEKKNVKESDFLMFGFTRKIMENIKYN